MNKALKSFFVFLMTTALAFGFLNPYMSDLRFNIDRLHIFLFNLCSGGTIVLLYTEGRKALSLKTGAFLAISIIYAFLAFFEIYSAAIACSVILAIIVESLRVKTFSFFPWNFFDGQTPVSKKFNQASLLCLSLGLLISSGVIINNEYTHFVSIPKLQLDTFFLGFSFPLSLITMSVMFSIMKPDREKMAVVIRNACFWAVNLGVIIFFLFILMESLAPQVVVTAILFVSVCVILYLFVDNVDRLQQKSFLTSGMLFLLYTAVSGIAYIIMEFFPAYHEQSATILLKIHSFSSLYGWNLSGLAVILRYEDFPIRLHSRHLIFAHWIIVAFLAPMGYYIPVFALFATMCYFIFLCMLFFAKGKNNINRTFAV